MARYPGCRHPWRDGPHQPGPYPARERTGRTLRNPDATASVQGRRTGAGREPPPGEDGILMEIKPGYKLTEVGPIPEDWERTTVSGIASRVRNAIVGGPFGSDLVSTDYVKDGVPVIR